MKGSVCAIELSFDHEGRVFLFDLRTEWFDDFSEMLTRSSCWFPIPTIATTTRRLAATFPETRTVWLFSNALAHPAN